MDRIDKIKILKERLAILQVNDKTNSRLARKWKKELKEEYMNIENYDALIWCETCKGYLPLVTKNDFKCPNCGRLLRKGKKVIKTLDKFL